MASTTTGLPMRGATRDARLSATVVSRTPLRYTSGADSSLDRPAHVRAASGIALIAGQLAIIQDDSNFVALIDPANTGDVRAVALPAGADGRRQFGQSGGNKHLKLDLEACFTVETPEPLLIAFGSGSTAARESIVIISGWPDALVVRQQPAPAMYGALRSASHFAGSELNIEGAVLRGDDLWLFNRGNGMRVESRMPVNSMCRVSWSALRAFLHDPSQTSSLLPERVQQFDLGKLEGVSLGFTDATSWRGAMLYCAAAEESPDVVRDGPVSGSVLGIMHDGGDVRWAPITDFEGRILREKAEGIAVADDASGEVWVVADVDDELCSSELWRVRLDGEWHRA